MRIEAGRWKGRPLPPVGAARPASARLRRSLFSVLEARWGGAHVLDLFAGAGTFGLEAVSRGAARAVLLDRDPRAIHALKAWAGRVGLGREVDIRRRDVERGALPEGPFDVVFLDPPYSLWEDRARSGRLVARAVGVLARDGVVAAKVPATARLEGDPRWSLLRRREVGSSAWALLGAPEDTGPTSG